jgi:hypothetical protein
MTASRVLSELGRKERKDGWSDDGPRKAFRISFAVTLSSWAGWVNWLAGFLQAFRKGWWL